MISFTEAVQLVKEELKIPGGDPPIELMLEHTIEEEFGWVFFYNSKEYLTTGNMSAHLVGNAPIIVDKFDHSLHYTGTAEPIEIYIKRYKEARKL